MNNVDIYSYDTTIEESSGELYTLPYLVIGKWLQERLNQISKLFCSFGEKSESLPNGIDIYKTHRGYKKNQQHVGINIALFLVSAYLVKNFIRIKGIDERISYIKPINIVLETLDSDSDSDNITKINQSCIESMKTILNHPHFENCREIEDIIQSFPSVKDLNHRFGKLDTE